MKLLKSFGLAVLCLIACFAAVFAIMGIVWVLVELGKWTVPALMFGIVWYIVHNDLPKEV